MNFVHLHVHSDFSLLDGACRHDKLLALSKAQGQPAIAVTDHGNLFGAAQFVQKARKAGVQPILGCEVYTVPGESEKAHFERGTGANGQRDYNHLLLLASSAEGWANLSSIVTEGYAKGFYYKPRVSHGVLARHSKGLIVTTGCMRGEVAQALLRGDKETARRSLDRLVSDFGRENLYVEVQSNGVAEQTLLNQELIAIAKERGLPLVATCDAHYLRPEDAPAQDALVCISTGKRLADRDRMRMEGRFFIRSPEEMARECATLGIPSDALTNTLLIAERCKWTWPKPKWRWPRITLPKFYTDGGGDLIGYFRECCGTGMRDRGLEGKPGYRERYEEERAVIEKQGFVPYFLLMARLVASARDNDVPVGPGRGSAAGSLVSYLLKITDIDPIEHKLLFERFLTPDRVSPPDIDVDFGQKERDKVIERLREEYRCADGRDAVARIATFGELASRAALRDVARVLDIPLDEVNRVSKAVPDNLVAKHRDLKWAIDNVPDVEAAADANKVWFDLAQRVEGMTKHVGIHASGIVVADTAIADVVPLYRDPKEKDGGPLPIAAWDMVALEEEAGLIKFDILGLKTLDVLQSAARAAGNIDLSPAGNGPIARSIKDPSTAPELWAAFCNGDGLGVFQCDSSGMRDLLRRLKPDSFEDIIALGALYRPGPLECGMVESYVERKHGREPVVYDPPQLETVLGATYGCIVYQEQVMHLVRVLAGFSGPDSDSVRKAMGKKKPEEMKKWKDKFLAGAEKTCGREAADRTWERVSVFAGYGFNRSHAAAYGVLTLQTAWLKTYHPAPFYAALLTSESDADVVATYVQDAVAHNIEIARPCVQDGVAAWRATGPNAVRVGYGAVRGVGEEAARRIEASRAVDGTFRSLSDLVARTSLTKGAYEALARAGALDSFGERERVFAAAESVLKAGRRTKADVKSKQKTFFDDLEDTTPQSDRLPAAKEWTLKERAEAEKKSLGFYLTSHPFSEFTAIESLICGARKGRACVAGCVSNVKTKNDRQGRLMGWVTLEREDGSTTRCVLFSRAYNKYADLLEDGAAVFATGKLEGDSSVLDEVVKAEDAFTLCRGVVVKLRTQADIAPTLAILARHRGNLDVELWEGDWTGEYGSTHSVKLSQKLIAELDAFLGEGATILKPAY